MGEEHSRKRINLYKGPEERIWSVWGTADSVGPGGKAGWAARPVGEEALEPRQSWVKVRRCQQWVDVPRLGVHNCGSISL